jgi:branched-chain amino acid transport system permease protein
MAPRRTWTLVISGDPPGHWAATLLVVLLVAVLAAVPWVFPSTRALAAAGRICIFVVLAASYDILLGYTGIVSFAHAVFFAIGAYGVAIPLAAGWVGWGGVALGAVAGVAVAMAVAAGIGLLSLRVRALFFSMITLAVASFAQLLATQWRSVTGGEDGLTFAVPWVLTPAFRVHPFGVTVDGRIIAYYLVFGVAVALFLLMLRVVNSPFGRVLQAIRENPFRAEALGYRIVVCRTLAGVVAAAMAALAGCLMALLMRYTGPEATLSFGVMVDILLMVVIGGMGTLYGPALGAAILVLAQSYLQPGLQGVADLLAPLPVLPALFQPDRWLLWLGLLFILMVYFFPAGVVGSLRRASR